MINAAIGHILNLVALLVRYLSIALPFVPEFPKRMFVGRPIIKENSPFLNTTKYRDAYALWMSSTANKDDAKSRGKYRSFLQAFALLSQSISYLAWTQGVQGVGLDDVDGADRKPKDVKILATSLLRLLRAMADSSGLGMRAHEPGFGALAHLGFSLDVVQVVSSTLDTEVTEDVDHSEDWDIVESQWSTRMHDVT